jgi:hypothetical protein
VGRPAEETAESLQEVIMSALSLFCIVCLNILPSYQSALAEVYVGGGTGTESDQGRKLELPLSPRRLPVSFRAQVSIVLAWIRAPTHFHHLCYWLVSLFVYRRVDETRAKEYMDWWKVHSSTTHAMYQLADKKNQQYDVASKRLAEREKQQKKIRDG